MSQTTMQHVMERLREAACVEQTPDAALLDAFVGEQSETAFAELVRRHGPMVWGVCWRLLSSRQDAEDCYQATFLVLVRKARTVRPRSRVAAWLHGVAYHAALKARQLAAKRRGRELPIDRCPEPTSKVDNAAELRQLLDRGLNELPDKYRIPIVMCELEGRSIKDVAAEMGSPIGTVAGWLSRGRSLLVRRLAKHGLTAVALAALFAERSSAAPPSVSALSASVLTLADATARALFVATVKSWLVSVVALAVIVGGLAWMAHVASDGSNADAPGNPVPALVPVQHPEKKPAVDGPIFVAAQKKDDKALINKKTQKAIDDALAFLAGEQAEDGSWGTGQFKSDVGITSIVGQAFLSGNHSPDRGKYAKHVTKAVRFILTQENKDTPGYFKGAGAAHGPMYGQGFAMLFLADAHETATDKKLKADIKAALERAVKLVIAAQNADGGWRYTPKPLDADLSVTACQIAALHAARNLGIDVPKGTADKASAYVKRCQHPDGGFRYLQNGGPSGFARTAAGLVSLNRLGAGGKPADDAMAYLQQADLKSASVQLHYFYGHYYAAKAMWYAGDKDFQKWYPPIRDELLASQKQDRWSQGTITDPHFGTAMALIILQMPHGHLPSLKR